MAQPAAIEIDQQANYKEVIREAYLEPIRSVTIIDDDYPTLESFIYNHRNNSQRAWKDADLDRLEAFISLCRDEQYSWAVDVYDAQSPPLDRMKHLTYSDLVILDYHLIPESPESNEKALECTSFLAKNNHFNLIVVHTKGINDGDIGKVFEEILMSLTEYPEIGVSPGGYSFEDISEIIDTARDEDAQPLNSLLESTSTLIAIKSLAISNYKSLYMPPQSPFNGVKDDLYFVHGFKDVIGPDVTVDDIVWWLVWNQIQKHRNEFSLEHLDEVRWDYSENCNWISSGKIFLTVIKKGDSADVQNIPENLLLALEDSLPSPMLLLMAKMRAEMEENGFLEATKIANDKSLQAGWLFEMLSKSDKYRHIAADKILEKQWDRISTETRPRLRALADKIMDSLKGEAPRDVVKRFLGGDVISSVSDSLIELNCYNCSKDVNSHHLSTGHILEFQDDDQLEYWVCLSPACDLVPEQKNTGWYGRIGTETMLFKAVKLLNADPSTAITNINSNDYILVKIDENIKSFYIPDGKAQLPEWEQMFASDSGIFGSGNILSSIQRIKKEDVLTFETIQNVRVVSELRYEYAINLLQRLGGALSRVGLDFVPKLWND
jgi:hypothetical protein